MVIICNVAVNSGEYIQAVCDRNLAENISRVLYPNDNVRTAVFRFTVAQSSCMSMVVVTDLLPIKVLTVLYRRGKLKSNLFCGNMPHEICEYSNEWLISYI